MKLKLKKMLWKAMVKNFEKNNLRYKVCRYLHKVVSGGVLFEKDFSHSPDYESFKRLSIGGIPQYPYGTNSAWDCSGKIFCSSAKSYLFGFISIGQYNLDV